MDAENRAFDSGGASGESGQAGPFVSRLLDEGGVFSLKEESVFEHRATRTTRSVPGYGRRKKGIEMYKKSKQMSVFLENKPGELSRLAKTLGDHGVNILAMSIQDPAEHIQGLFRAREVTLRRIASTASYSAILKEASLLTLVRFVTSETEESVRILREAGYNVNTNEVILTVLEHRPGMLAAISECLAKEAINIDYTYGSSLEEMDKALFVFRVSDIKAALKALNQ